MAAVRWSAEAAEDLHAVYSLITRDTRAVAGCGAQSTRVVEASISRTRLEVAIEAERWARDSFTFGHDGSVTQQTIMAPRHVDEASPATNPSVGLCYSMPTIFVIGGFAVRMYRAQREHGPPHVHVWKAGTRVVILLGDAEHGPSIGRVHGMKPPDVARAYRIVASHQELLLRRWRQYNG